MYRVFAIVIGGLALAACSSTPDWLNLDALKPAPAQDTVRFESDPPGAEAKTSDGQVCRTPCALAVPSAGPMSVTFSLNGYLPDSETIEPIANSTGYPEMRPNPVVAQLQPAPPPPKPIKKPVRKRKPAPKPKPKTTAAPPPATTAAPPTGQPAPAPWPTNPPPAR
ncbi:MAG: PEGA domain-containing protein [Pseudolabrys sp.]